ncbi:MAG: hypothetical protein SVK08_13010 [Halobacteriota archaeon]|nr:hypothetical protein [Halobacteriota archaeon]
MIELNYGEGRCALSLRAIMMGDDYVINIIGEGPHVGAVGVGNFDNGSNRASSSVITLSGHRDDRIAKEAAEKISKKTKRSTVVTVGIHLENITEREINTILSNSEQIIDIFLNYIEE